MKRAPLLAALLILSCEPVVRRAVTLRFNDAGDKVVISASTTLGSARPGTADEATIDEERDALLAGNDAWSVRFANADPEFDHVTFDRRHGILQSVEHSATIPSDNLQKFFFDMPMTVNMIRGDGWAELDLVAGTSMRASPAQQRQVDETIRQYSKLAAEYFSAVRTMYLYLDEKPQRANDLFTAFFRGDDSQEPPVVSQSEQSIVDGVRVAAEALVSSAPDLAGNSEFDRVFNPFPADVRVVLPSAPLIVEGFAKEPDGSLRIQLPEVVEAVTSLEGRWISPDPLGVALAAGAKQSPEQLAALIADQPRHAEAVVSAKDIADALVAKMQPAPRYRVRFITR